MSQRGDNEGTESIDDGRNAADCAPDIIASVGVKESTPMRTISASAGESGGRSSLLASIQGFKKKELKTVSAMNIAEGEEVQERSGVVGGVDDVTVAPQGEEEVSHAKHTTFYIHRYMYESAGHRVHSNET